MPVNPMQFAPITPMQKRPDPGAALLQQVRGMQTPGAGAPGAMPPGFIERMMQGNPGGLIGALMNRSSMPVNPGTPAPAGDPAYVPGGEGPAMGTGGAPVGGGGAFGADKAGMMGMLSKMFGGFGGG